MNPLAILVIYLLVGVIVLGIFDLTTKRIRRKLRTAGYDTQDALANAGQTVGTKLGLVIISVYTLVFWPVVMLGAATSLFKRGT